MKNRLILAFLLLASVYTSESYATKGEENQARYTYVRPMMCTGCGNLFCLVVRDNTDESLHAFTFGHLSQANGNHYVTASHDGAGYTLLITAEQANQLTGIRLVTHPFTIFLVSSAGVVMTASI